MVDVPRPCSNICHKQIINFIDTYREFGQIQKPPLRKFSFHLLLFFFILVFLYSGSARFPLDAFRGHLALGVYETSKPTCCRCCRGTLSFRRSTFSTGGTYALWPLRTPPPPIQPGIAHGACLLGGPLGNTKASHQQGKRETRNPLAKAARRKWRAKKKRHVESSPACTRRNGRAMEPLRGRGERNAHGLAGVCVFVHSFDQHWFQARVSYQYREGEAPRTTDEKGRRGESDKVWVSAQGTPASQSGAGARAAATLLSTWLSLGAVPPAVTYTCDTSRIYILFLLSTVAFVVLFSFTSVGHPRSHFATGFPPLLFAHLWPFVHWTLDCSRRRLPPSFWYLVSIVSVTGLGYAESVAHGASCRSPPSDCTGCGCH